MFFELAFFIPPGGLPWRASKARADRMAVKVLFQQGGCRWMIDVQGMVVITGRDGRIITQGTDAEYLEKAGNAHQQLLTVFLHAQALL